jgi:hypothetical protein
VTLSPPRLAEALTTLRGRVADVRLGLATVDRDVARRAARGVVDQIDDYLLPRLRDLDAPLLTVVGGSTGAGKSTLVNSLVGAPVTVAGVLRPTTRAPVLVCAAEDLPSFAGNRVLPGLPRVTGAAGGAGTLQLVPRDDVPSGLALLDAPDVDSVVESNRDLAGQLLAAADLWIFVTTAARYADAVPWDLLRTAQERGTALAVVLDRVPPEAVGEVAADLSGMLQRVAGTDLGPDRTPLWQRAVGGLQWLLLAAAVAGGLWLLALVALGFFRVDDVVPLPRVAGVPVPTLLVVAGLLAGALLAVLVRPFVRWRARRRRRQAERRLRAAIEQVAEEELLAPMAEVRQEHDRFRAAVRAACR